MRHRFRSLTLSIFLASWDVRWTVSGSPDKPPTTWRMLPPSTGCIAGCISGCIAGCIDAGWCSQVGHFWVAKWLQDAVRLNIQRVWDTILVIHALRLKLMRLAGTSNLHRFVAAFTDSNNKDDHPQEMTIVTICYYSCHFHPAGVDKTNSCFFQWNELVLYGPLITSSANSSWTTYEPRSKPLCSCLGRSPLQWRKDIQKFGAKKCKTWHDQNMVHMLLDPEVSIERMRHLMIHVLHLLLNQNKLNIFFLSEPTQFLCYCFDSVHRQNTLPVKHSAHANYSNRMDNHREWKPNQNPSSLISMA